MRVYVSSHNEEGKRTWVSVGHISPVSLEGDEFVMFIQVVPGKVYHARMKIEELLEANRWTPVSTDGPKS